MLQKLIFMKGRFLLLGLSFLFAHIISAQQITFSESYREDSRDMNFEIIGKLKGNIIIFKNIRNRYAINVFNDSMILKGKDELEFLPNRVFNVDYVAYPDFFYLIYQYQKKSILYCMAVKMDAEGKKMEEPVELDTTHVGPLGDNKIYSTINSEDKKKIMVFKIQKKNDQYNFATLLFDNQLKLIKKSRQSIDYDDSKTVFSDFLLDNEGTMVFTAAVKKGSRDNYNALTLLTKMASDEEFLIRKINLKGTYVDDVKVKVDNVNKHYILNTFYYKERNGSIEGVNCNIFSAGSDTTHISVFTKFDDDLRAQGKSSGNSKYAFNDFFIRNVILKKDGSFILHAEDYSTQSTGINNWNRSDYLFNSSPYLSPYNYYYYNPGYGGYYRPFSSFGNTQNVRYYYDNVLLLSVAKDGRPQWSNIIHKQQYSDDNDNYLSYTTFNTGAEIHFLYNDISKRNKLLSDNVIGSDGSSKRNPTLRTYEKGYEFMPRFAKQTGARQVIVPCTLRGEVCFAKIDF